MRDVQVKLSTLILFFPAKFFFVITVMWILDKLRKYCHKFRESYTYMDQGIQEWTK